MADGDPVGEVVEEIPPESHEEVEPHPVQVTEERVQEIVNGALEGVNTTLQGIETRLTELATQTTTAVTELPTDTGEIVADPVKEVFDDSPPKTYRGPAARAIFSPRKKQRK